MFFLAIPPSPPIEMIYEQPASSYLAALRQLSKGKPRSEIDDLFDRLFVEQMADSPQWLTFLGLFESVGLKDHNRYLDDVSIENEHRSIEQAKSHWLSLQSFVGDAGPEEKLTRQVLLYRLQTIIDGEKFLFHTYPITQMTGLLRHLTFLFMSCHPLDDRADVETYLFRLGQIEKQFTQVMEKIRHQEEKGIFPPHFAIEKSIQSIEKLIENPVEKHPFYMRLAGQPEDVLAEAKQILTTQVYPAYQKLRDFLQQYLQRLSRNEGLWALPDGDAYYAHVLKEETTLNLSPKEIHEIGLQQVAEIEAEIKKLLIEEGLWDETLSIGEHLIELRKKPEYHFQNSEEGQAQCLKKFEEIVARATTDLGPLFSVKPKAPLRIEATPPHEQAGAALAYYLSTNVANTRPGTFFVNLRDSSSIATFSMETIAIHEAIPGHHFERSLAMELDAHISRTLFKNTAYVEGWALYVEKLGYEENFYSSRIDQIGHLQYELLRAARLVIDTGIHWKRWSREEAISYMSRTVGDSHSNAVAEIERYFVMPGQACTYKLGQLKILELREKAKKQLGDAFDIREFHHQILKRGSLPLLILEACIDEWLIGQKKSDASLEGQS